MEIIAAILYIIGRITAYGYEVRMDSRCQKHLILQDRYTIEEGLNHGYTLIGFEKMSEEVKLPYQRKYGRIA